MQGTIRTFTREALDLVKAKIVSISESTAKAFECRAEVVIEEGYPPVVNHKTEAEHV
jgi:metal-dependent amidase/aminoacylase/carboxypeptidase family protein